MVLYEVRSTIIYLGSQVSDLSGNSCAQKINKEQTKQERITGVKYFCGLWSFTCINRSGIYFV